MISTCSKHIFDAYCIIVLLTVSQIRMPFVGSLEMCMGEDSGELRLMSQKFNKKNKRFKDFRLEILPFIECFTFSLFFSLANGLSLGKKKSDNMADETDLDEILKSMKTNLQSVVNNSNNC